jgi:hypothetical protein
MQMSADDKLHKGSPMTTVLTQEQKQRALEIMREYLAAPKNEDGKALEEVQSERDGKRLDLIARVLNPLVVGYLSGNVPLAGFKSEVDSINKRHEWWGFKGVKGQMFFNLTVNAAEDSTELDHELKAAIIVPASEQIASSRLKTFVSYVKRLGQQVVESGGSPHARPNTGSVPFFLSYFWQIQDPHKWPVYYTNSVQVMTDLNLWLPSGEASDDYLAFKHIHEELAEIFARASGRKFSFYEVEHVFWFKGGNPTGGDRPLQKVDQLCEHQKSTSIIETMVLERLPDSYVPPIIQLLPRLACNDDSLTSAAKASGTTIARALEKSVDAAFTILGYETKLLGQGQGRVPDGLAVNSDDSYAIIWDSKARGDRYSMGTDDRTIREYIVTQSRELKRKRGFRNVYYVIVSGYFADDFDDSVRSLKMETDISEVVLLESDALVAMVDRKLRSPLQVSLGPDGLQRLFTTSGILTGDDVRELMS